MSAGSPYSSMVESMVFTLFGLLMTCRDGCRGKLSFLYPSNKILLQFSWTQYSVNHNKWPSKRPTLTRDAIQYETKRDFSTSPSVMFNLLSFAMYRSMSFELKCAVNSVALKLMLAPFISYSLPAVLACQPAWWRCKNNGSRDCRSSLPISHLWQKCNDGNAIMSLVINSHVI